MNTTDLNSQEWHKWADRKNLSTEEVVRFAHGRRTADVILRYSPGSNLTEELEAFLQTASQFDQTSVRPIDGAVEFVKMIQSHCWAVVTSAPVDIAKRRLVACGFPVPQALVCAENVKRGKPEPEGFLRAAKLLQVQPEECLVFEDTSVGVHAAERAGMKVIALTSTSSATEFRCNVVSNFRSLEVTLTSDNKMHLIQHRGSSNPSSD